MVVFFVLTSIAAIGAMLSLLEVPVLILHERMGLARPKAIAACIGVVALLGAACALSGNILSGFLLFGRNMFELMDFVSSNVLLPLGGILIALFAGWVWGRERFSFALSNDGALHNAGLAKALMILLRYVSPLLILLVMLHGLGML